MEPTLVAHRLPLARPGASDTPRLPPRAVRLSITDRCDLACVYCRPADDAPYLDAAERLPVAHWIDLVKSLRDAGIHRVRLTGGEPLSHPNVIDIVRGIAALPGIDDLALTTNATRLARFAAPLRDAGLARLNISLDSLDPARYASITRGGRLDHALAGIDTALAAGFTEIKTNSVVMGPAPDGDPSLWNDHELDPIVRWAWGRGIVPRFIELMGIGAARQLRASPVSRDQMLARLAALLADGPGARPEGRGPAEYFVARDGSGRRVGFIAGRTRAFCADCDRLRVTSDGRLRPCLASSRAFSIAEALRAGSARDAAAVVETAWRARPDASAWRGCAEEGAAEVSMRVTGG